MNLLLDLTSGVCWSVVYVFAAFQGIRHKTWCIPRLAICQNLAWEFWVVLYRLQSGEWNSSEFAVQLSWLILDIFVFLTWILRDSQTAKKLGENVVLLIVVFTYMYVWTYVFNEWEASAFAINAIMSITFSLRFTNDRSAWTSIFIAVCKLIGTLSATILNGICYSNPLLLWLGGVCFLFDGYYLGLLINKLKGDYYGKTK